MNYPAPYGEEWILNPPWKGLHNPQFDLCVPWVRHNNVAQIHPLPLTLNPPFCFKGRLAMDDFLRQKSCLSSRQWSVTCDKIKAFCSSWAKTLLDSMPKSSISTKVKRYRSLFRRMRRTDNKNYMNGWKALSILLWSVFVFFFSSFRSVRSAEMHIFGGYFVCFAFSREW